MNGFSEVTRRWFAARFGEPTDAQMLGWPSIMAGRPTLIAAPTGSGKTLAAFLAGIDRLIQQGLAGQFPETVQTLYISPLKALSNDIRRNLETPLDELTQTALEMGFMFPPIRTAVRTGDTPAAERQKMLRRPPHILVTTPESLYLLLTSAKARNILADVKTVIIDEIHALARDKRGSHLALSLERLDHLTKTPPVRIGLSATQRPLDLIARFLVGERGLTPDEKPECDIVDVGHVRQLDLAVEVPQTELGAVCSNEQWAQVYERLCELIESHRSTIVFVNTRKLAERISYHLSDRLGKDHVTSHHGSLSKDLRLDAEQRLKSGELKVLVATASLELGIDVGYIDLVCQIGSPRSIATFLQRVGRSGHSLGAIPKGRLFALTRDELIESLALVRSVKRGVLDKIEIPQGPLDILSQQISAAVGCEEWDERELYETFKRAWPYRNLSREDFESIVSMLSEPISRGTDRGARLHRDRINGKIRAARGTRLIAASCGGAIPDNADYRVVTAEEGVFVGTINEDFAIESSAGDVFLLGNTSWRVVQVKTTEVVVSDAQGAPPTIPFWIGEAPGRTIELSHEVAELRRELADRVDIDRPNQMTDAIHWLRDETGTDHSIAEFAVDYIANQKAALGLVPTDTHIVFERFFDEMGGMQLVIHAPFGARLNRGWGLAMRKRFCRSFDFELQASADDDGIVLSLGPQHSFPIDQLFSMLTPRNAQHILEQALLDSPLFKVRWRWNATRALLVPRQKAGKRVPPPLLRFRSDDMLTSVFPASTACLENRPEDIELPDHPIVQQTMKDCLFEATDCDRFVDLLGKYGRGEITFVARDTREPSPFCHQRLNAQPYAFLDDAPLEERRARAVSTRRTLSIDAVRDLCALDVEAIERVTREAWPSPRSPDELHESLMELHVLPVAEVKRRSDMGDWSPLFQDLLKHRRVLKISLSGTEAWAPAELWPSIESAYGDRVSCANPPVLPPELNTRPEDMAARNSIIRGWMQLCGPVTALDLANRLVLPPVQVESCLEMIEATGAVIRGHIHPDEKEIEWCDRRLLARIHRLTLDGVRKRIQPVSGHDYLRLLIEHHGISNTPRDLNDERIPLIDVVKRLAGFEAPAGSWEFDLFATRLPNYDPSWLDHLTITGEVAWGRLEPPSPSTDRKRMSGLTRVVPISIFPRMDLLWLLPQDRRSAEDFARGDALTIWEILKQRGALFHSDLIALSGMLPSQVEQSLSELAALGLVSADGFAGIRSLVSIRRQASKSPRRRTGRPGFSSYGQRAGGRWSIFPPIDPLASAEVEARAERWAELLLERYAIVFRDLLTRETAAPPWWQLAAVYRRWEAQGKVHGGRFVEGVGAEQYALPGMIDRLRALRDKPPEADWIILSAADPLNLVGIVTRGERVAATHGNALALRGGKLVATRVAGEVEFHETISPEETRELRRLILLTGEARAHHRARLRNFPAEQFPISSPMNQWQ
jgi:ATP-dependent Lhr-like helicase